MFGEIEVVDIEPNIISESKMLITKINLQKRGVSGISRKYFVCVNRWKDDVYIFCEPQGICDIVRKCYLSLQWSTVARINNGLIRVRWTQVSPWTICTVKIYEAL